MKKNSNYWKKKNTLLFLAVSPKDDQMNRNCRLWFQQALSYHTLQLTDIFHFSLCLLTHCPYFTCRSHEHSMTLNYKVLHFDSTKYKWLLYGMIQLITEVFIGCLPKLCKKKCFQSTLFKNNEIFQNAHWNQQTKVMAPFNYVL